MRSPVKIWRERKERYRYLGEEGEVVSFTRIMEGMEGFGKEAYWIVLVEMGKKKRVMGQWVEREEPKIGDGVIGVLRRVRQPEKTEVIEYGVKWKKQ
jgi:uncharacterized OB-fold protein